MLNLQHVPDIAALAEPHAANAVKVLADALQQDDGPARVAAAIALLAISHQQPLQLLAVEGGVAVEVNAATSEE
jgi:hypothetical protein